MPLIAPLGRRVAARAIDLVIALLIGYLVGRFVPEPRVIGRLLISLVLLSAYEALFVIQLKATPGKLATGIRVAPLDREVIDPAAAWIRGALTSVSVLSIVVLPPVLNGMTNSGAGFGLGTLVVMMAGGFALAVVTAPARRGMADRAADTVVVPHEAPAVVTSDSLSDELGRVRPRPLTPWGPAATHAARRRGRTARLDDAPLLVVALVAVILAWSFDRTWLAVGLSVGWAVLLIFDEARRIARDAGTAGHRREGLLVLDEATGEAPTRGAAMMRSITLGVFWLFPPLLVVLAIWMRLSRTGRGPHDLVAGTVVVERKG